MPGESILIIEDDATLLRGLKDNFSFKGYAVSTAQDGESGLALTARQTVVPNLVAGAIRDKKVRRYCRRYWDRGSGRIRAAKKVLADWKKGG